MINYIIYDDAKSNRSVDYLRIFSREFPTLDMEAQPDMVVVPIAGKDSIATHETLAVDSAAS